MNRTLTSVTSLASLRSLASVAVVAAAVFVSAGCGDGIGCDFRDGSLNGPEDRCQERLGFQSIGFGPACAASGGVEIEGGCPTEGIVGGCDLGQGVFDWYYEPFLRDDINCDDGEVLDPPG